MPNNNLLEETMQFIERHPDIHNQGMWLRSPRLESFPVPTDHEELARCGAAGCFFGWAVLLSGKAKEMLGSDYVLAVNGRVRERHVQNLAQELLELDEETAELLAESSNSQATLREMVDEIKETGRLDDERWPGEDYD